MKKNKWFAMMLLLALSSAAAADEVLVAVASNFADAANELAPKFQAKTGHTVKYSLGATGKFATQIENGAPFDILLSADAERPVALEEKGLGVKGSRFVYAVGTLVLWSPKAGYVDNKGEVLKKDGFGKVALANPQAAPYGVAAVETLQALGLWDKVSPKVVQGENIGQTFQFAATGNAQLAFVALSQVLPLDSDKRGSWWEVPAKLHTPIDQQAILLKPAENKAAARAFLDYLKSDEAKAIIKRYGYRM